MNLCSDGHAEVCFESEDCPVCIIVAEHERETDNLTDQIHGLESELSDAQAEISSLNQQLPPE